MVCNSIGGVYKIEIAPKSGAFSSFSFTPNSPEFVEQTKQDERGLYKELDLVFSFVYRQYPLQFLELIKLANYPVKLKLTDASGEVFTFGSNLETFDLNVRQEMGLDSIIIVNVKGFLLCV